MARHARAGRAAILVAGLATTVGNDAVLPAGTDLALFTISKSENKNQVQYVIRVDDRCVPAGGAPVRAYWRMFERGPTVIEPLLEREQAAYGLAKQSVTERTEDGGKTLLVLNAVSHRPVSVETSHAASGECLARPVTTVAGEDARLFDIYVKLAWPVGVSYVLLRGWSLDGARLVTETLHP